MALRSPRPPRLAVVLCSVGTSACALALLGCTPLGGWLYDDPTFVLSEVEVRGGTDVSDTLALVLTGCNRNDFAVIGTSLGVSMAVEGQPLAPIAVEELFTLNQRDSLRFVVPLAWQPPAERPNGGRVQIALSGYTILKTPIGERRVPFMQRGSFGLSTEPKAARVSPAGRACHPGQSTLPSQYTTPVYIDPRDQPPPGVPVGLPGSPGSPHN